MLHTETVEARTLDLIRALMSDTKLQAFFLVGGTALSLKLGHRISIDIDMFSDKEFDAESIGAHLKGKYGLTDDQVIKNGAFGFIDQVKVDFISHRYPLLKPMEVIDGIRMLSLEDIGAMKLHAIVQNGSRLKDFIDVYYLLEKIPFGLLSKAYCQKYPNATPQMAHSGLLYHADIDFSVPVTMLKSKLDWAIINDRLRNAVLKNHWSVFEQDQPKEQTRQKRGTRL